MSIKNRERRICSGISEKNKVNILMGIIIGILIHGFALANKWPNWDDLGQTWDYMNRSTLGRWMLVVPGTLSGPLSMPWINGMLSIIYIVLGANLVISLLDVQNRLIQFMVQAVMLAFPAIGAAMFYTNSIDGYTFGILLMCLGVWSVAKKNSSIGIILGVVGIIASMACYQAYVAFGAALAISFVIWKTTYCENDFRDVLRIVVRYIITFGIGIIGYIVISKLITRNVGLTSYMGIDKMGSINLKAIPGQLITAYKSFFGVGDTESGFMFPAMIGLMVLAVILLVCSMWKRKNDWKKNLLIILMLFAFPIACNLIYLMGSEYVHTIMLYGLVGVFILCLTIFDKSKAEIKYLSSLGIFVVGAVVWIYTVETNMAYFCAHVAYEETYAYAERLLTKIELTENFSSDDEVYLIGTPEWNFDRLDVGWMKEPVFTTFTGLPKNMVQNGAFPVLCKKYLGFQQEISYITVEKSTQMEYTNLIDEMPVYPNDGAIARTEEGYILVKLSEIQ